jgi:osmotically-inducible protein OsmY
MRRNDVNQRIRIAQRDRDLEARVNQALWSYSPLRESRCPIIVIARAEVVELTGTVRTERMKRTVLRLAEAVPGVRKVQDNLVSDESLEQEIRQRLIRNTSTHSSANKVTVHSVLGAVYLKGQVESAMVKEEVGRIASQVPGAQMVINELNVQNHNAVQLKKAA